MQLLALSLSGHLIQEVKARLVEESFDKIKACVDQLSEGQVWHRPNENLNSVGNLILHLCGNVRQYIVAGAGGKEDIRVRNKEFSERGPIAKAELIQKMADVLAEVDQTLDQLTPEQLVEIRPVQCYEMSVLAMIVHATEHFSYHTGQIIYYTKLVKDMDMAFYAGMDLEAKDSNPE